MQAISLIEKVIGKENIENFLKEFKAALTTLPKEGEVKEVDISIRGGKTEPDGISSETFTVNKNQYPTYIAEEKDYMKEAISIVTIGIKAKDAGSVSVLEKVFNDSKDMVNGIPGVAEHADKFSLHFRTQGDQIFLDVALKDDSVSKVLQEVGIDFADYHSFKGAIKTGFAPLDFYNCNAEQIAEKALTLLFSIKGTLTNGSFLGKSVIKALDSLKIEDEKIQKKIKKAKTIITAMNAFGLVKFLFEYNPKELYNSFVGKATQLIGGNLDEQLESARAASGMGKEIVKGSVEGFGMLEPIKAANFDVITIAVLSPKFKSGIVHELKLPGITQIINEKFLD